MKLPPPVPFMGVAVHPWTMAQTVAAIDHALAAGRFVQHAVVNVAKLMSARRDDSLRAALAACEIVSIDGMGVVWGARALGVPVPERVAGIDLFHELLALAERRGHPVFLLGAREQVLERAVTVLRRQHPALQLAGWHHGYFWDHEQALVARVRASGARLLFVAVSSPAKELFVHRWREALGVGFVMGVGGTFDVVAGYTRRAPRWMQGAGLEWAWRLAQEPRRMWRRYLLSNGEFALRLAVQWLARRLPGA